MSEWNVDSYGCIVQSDKDGGDSLHRCAMVLVAEELGPRADVEFIRLYAPYMDWITYRLRRHPDHTKWYSQWGVSRDQMIPVLSHWLLCDFGYPIGRLIKQNFWFATNDFHNGKWRSQSKWKLPDFMFLHIMPFYLRTGKDNILKRICREIFDLQFVFNSIIWRYAVSDKTTDVNNHAISIATFRRVHPTFAINISRRIVHADLINKKLTANRS